MSQCVPSWDLDGPPPNPSPLQQPENYHHQQPSSAAPLVPLTDYEVTELTWQNGQLALHGIGYHHRDPKPFPKYPTAGDGAAANAAWSKHQLPRDTLEAVVNQATGANLFTGAAPVPTPNGLGEWLGGPHPVPAPAPAHVPPTAVDALVPCRDDVAGGDRVPDPAAGRIRARGRKRLGVCSSQGSAAAPLARQRAESTLVTIDSCGVTDDYGLTSITATNSASPDEFAEGSPETENTSFGYESNSHRRRSQPKPDDACDEDVKVRKRSRAAAIHIQSERKRRDRISQKMKTLQKLVPNSSKTDKASILDEAIDYMKQLQAQVQMISRMSSMMLPMPMPMPMPQLQMSMMANMAQMAQMAQVGMGMLDTTSVASRPAPYPPPVPPLLHPPPFIPPLNAIAAAAAAAAAAAPAPWDMVYSVDQQMQQQSTKGSNTIRPDHPLSSFIASQDAQYVLRKRRNKENLQMLANSTTFKQAVTQDAYSRMATLVQQWYQQQSPANNTKRTDS